MTPVDDGVLCHAPLGRHGQLALEQANGVVDLAPHHVKEGEHRAGSAEGIRVIERLREADAVLHAGNALFELPPAQWTAPDSGTNTLIVTHKPNILDAFGKDWFEVKEGEASIFKPESSGFTLVARVQIAEWAIWRGARGAVSGLEE